MRAVRRRLAERKLYQGMSGVRQRGDGKTLPDLRWALWRNLVARRRGFQRDPQGPLGWRLQLPQAGAEGFLDRP